MTDLSYKEEFLELFNEHVHRQGAAELLEWLEKTDFFTAPASTRYHCACNEGLVMHSISVFKVMVEKHFDEEKDNMESFAVCALLHDLCKAEFYKVSTRNVKNEETGKWDKVPYYAIEYILSAPASAPGKAKAPANGISGRSNVVDRRNAEQGIEELPVGKDGVYKVLIDGQIYILRGDNIYTLDGQLVR